MTEEDEAFEDLAKRQGDWGLQGSRKHQIMRYAENVENKGTSMTDREAMKLALDSLETLMIERGSIYEKAITALKERLAQPEQEPVAWLCTPNEDGLFGLPLSDYCCIDCFPVYRHPPQRTWVGLTDEEIKEFDTWHDNREEEVGWCNPSEIVAYIEAKLKEKNT